MHYQKLVERDRRLVVLRCTLEGDGTANDSLLRSMLRSWGIASTEDHVRGTIEWLVEHGLLVSATKPGGTVVVTITRQGEEVARGHATHPEVTPRRAQAT